MEAKDNNMERITREYMNRNLDRFHAMEFNWTNVGEMPWDESSFLLDLPLKWNLSFAVEYKPCIVGYIIGSRANDMQAKVNKIVVDSEYRRQGFGKQLMERFEEECSNNGIYEVELKALVENRSANGFYAELGYQAAGSVEGTDGKTRNVYYKRLK